MTEFQMGLFSDAVGERGNAVFSACERYRYVLSRRWADGPRCMFLMLNPSTADHRVNDPTVTRCINFAKAWGFGGLWVGNAFAFRSTDPAGLKRTRAPIGPANDDALLWMAADSDLVVCGWGEHGILGRRCDQVLELLAGHNLVALEINQSGQPKHPLYVRHDIEPVPYPRRAA